jgi:hypothetical protein
VPEAVRALGEHDDAAMVIVVVSPPVAWIG